MKPLVTLALMLALGGCSPQGGQHGTTAREHTRNEAAPATDTLATVPAAYEAFPEDVRTSIYQWDLINQKCTSRFRNRDEKVCAQRDGLSQELLAKGWCYGGSDEPAHRHWVRCAEDYPGGEGWIAGPEADLQPAG